MNQRAPALGWGRPGFEFCLCHFLEGGVGRRNTGFVTLNTLLST